MWPKHKSLTPGHKKAKNDPLALMTLLNPHSTVAHKAPPDKKCCKSYA